MKIKLVTVLILSLTCWGLTHFIGVESLIFDSEKESEFWRFLTAHFVHWDNQHFILNLVAMIVIVHLDQIPRSQFIKTTFLTIVLSDVYLLLVLEGTYAGFSTLIYAYLGVALVQQIRVNYKFGLLILLSVFVYLFFQYIHQKSVRGIKPLTELHLIGLLIGQITESYLMRFTFTLRLNPST